MNLLFLILFFKKKVLFYLSFWIFLKKKLLNWLFDCKYDSNIDYISIFFFFLYILNNIYNPDK